MSARAMTRRAATTAVVVAAALTLASCAAVPGSGPVEPGLADLKQAEQLVQFNASGPLLGATQEQIVRGFLTAANSPLDNYSVAREYLTPTYAAKWDPYFGVLVGDPPMPYRADDEDSGVLSLSVVAEVETSGQLLSKETGESTELRFEFMKQGDEWRISSAPSGVILDRTTFLAIWSPHQLYFFGPGNRLVPETRWFLSSTALATEIVRAMLEGSTERFRQVVHSGFPPGVQLTKNTVPVAGGLARVDLTGDGLDNAGTQQEILTQLKSTLQTVRGVNRVELLIDGVAVRDSTQPVAPSPAVSAGSKLAGRIDGRFGVLDGQSIEPITGLSTSVEGLSGDEISLSRSKTLAAVRGADGVYLVSDELVALIDSRPGQLPPSVDDDLWTWTVSVASPTIMHVTSPSGAQRDLSAPWLEGLDVTAVRVSPGGSLIGAFVNDGGKSYVLVAGVLRDNDGIPAALTPDAQEEMWVNGDAIDFDWIDQQRFVVLSKQGSAGKVTVGGPGMFASEQGSIPDATSIFGGGNRTQIRVLNAEGELFAPQGGSGWQRVASGVDVLAKRG